MDAELRRLLAVRRGACDASWTAAPLPGDAGLDLRPICPKCGKRVTVTVRGRFANHKSARRLP